MEYDQFRKRVYMQTLSSTFIGCKSELMPQWTSQNQLNFASSYQFSTYNIEFEQMEIINREQNQGDVLLAQYKEQLNENKCQIYYMYKENESYYLIHRPQHIYKKLLIYKNTYETRSKIMENFLNYLMDSETDYYRNSRHLINKTQLLIEEIDQQAKQQFQKENIYIKTFKDMKIIFQTNFAIFLVEMACGYGIMLINLLKTQREKDNAFSCPIEDVNLHKCDQVTRKQLFHSRIIYHFTENLYQIHKTKDITEFVLLSQSYIILTRINYESMQLSILSKVSTGSRFKGKVIEIGVNIVDQEEFITATVEIKQNVSMKSIKQSSARKFIRMYKICNKTIVQVNNHRRNENPLKYVFELRTLQILDDCCQSRQKMIRFNSNVIQSHYEIQNEKQDNKKSQNSVGPDLTSNIIMAVFSNILQENSSQQKVMIEKENNKITHQGIEIQCGESTEKRIKQIGSFVTNKDMVIIWEKDQPIIHICRIIGKNEQKQKNQKKKNCLGSNIKLSTKQNKMKEVYCQLIGNSLPEKLKSAVNYQSRLEYISKIKLELPYPKIFSVTLSPNNYNMLIISMTGNQKRENYAYSIFQSDLYCQLTYPDPNIFMKPIKNIHKNKPVQQIVSSFVKETAIFLTGNLIHSFDTQILQGALSFDIHPYHLCMAVSFGFAAKVYAIGGNQRLTSLYTMNSSGIKQIKYSPLGNHLCLLTSKSIKIIDSYSFMQLFLINQKSSNFIRCTYSSSGLELYTISENHSISIYNTFDYTRIDCIKPTINIQYKPIAIKSCPKHMQYCVVLQNGKLFVKYKSQAIIVTHQELYKYQDNQHILCIQIDERNGVLFAGTQNGKLRAHIWPMKQQQIFNNYTEIRIGFIPIQCICLTNVNSYLYVGNSNGSISKVKFVLERDKGIEIQQDHTHLFTETGGKHHPINKASNIQKVYKYVLTSSSATNDEDPEKIRLQFKLSEVITKLNEEMKKMKNEAKQQLQQKANTITEKFDLNLYFHLNKMITTKLTSQLQEQTDLNEHQLNELKQAQNNELQQIFKKQNQLMNQKTILISDYISQRNNIRQQMNQNLINYTNSFQQNAEKLNKEVGYAEREKMLKGDKDLSFLDGNCFNYKEQVEILTKELENQNKRHFQLRKQCAYKETVIRDINLKKIKEESLQFKIELQKSQMEKKLEYNRAIIKELKYKIEDAEQKVHKAQIQASIIKTTAQFKKVANIDEMNDACSFKLWVKEKNEKDIAQLSMFLHLIEETLEKKSGEMVDIVYDNAQKTDKTKQLTQKANKNKQKLQIARLSILNSRNKIRRICPSSQLKLIASANHSTRNSPNHSIQDDSSNNYNIKRAQSTRNFISSNANVPLYNKIMDKQYKFLKTNMKIHQRKINKYDVQGGQLLGEFQKLKFQNKQHHDKVLKSQNEIEKIFAQLKDNSSKVLNGNEKKHQMAKTSFQKYLSNKQNKHENTLKYKTVSSSPLKGCFQS